MCMIQEAVKGLPELLLARSASVVGFFLLHYTRQFRSHLRRLSKLVASGKLQVNLDKTRFRFACSRHHCVNAHCARACKSSFSVWT